MYDHAKPHGITTLRGWIGLPEAERRYVFQFSAGEEDATVIRAAVDLVVRCLTADPRRRPSMREVLAHPFLAVATLERSKHLKVRVCS